MENFSMNILFVKGIKVAENWVKWIIINNGSIEIIDL